MDYPQTPVRSRHFAQRAFALTELEGGVLRIGSGPPHVLLTLAAALVIQLFFTLPMVIWSPTPGDPNTALWAIPFHALLLLIAVGQRFFKIQLDLSPDRSVATVFDGYGEPASVNLSGLRALQLLAWERVDSSGEGTVIRPMLQLIAVLEGQQAEHGLRRVHLLAGTKPAAESLESCAVKLAEILGVPLVRSRQEPFRREC